MIDRFGGSVASGISYASICLCVAGALAAFALISSPDRMLARSYAVEAPDPSTVHLDDDGRTMPIGPIARVVNPTPEFAGELPLTGHLPTGAPVAIGSRITISAPDGRAQSLAVTAIEEIDGAGIGMTGIRFRMVTCRAENSVGPSIRFLVAIDGVADGKSAPLKL